MLTSPDWTLTHPGRRGSLPCINLSTKSDQILPADCSPAPSLQFPAGSPQPSFQPACYQKPAVKENGLLKYEGCRYAPSCVLLKVQRFTSSCVRLHWYRSIKLIMTHSWVMYVWPSLWKMEGNVYYGWKIVQTWVVAKWMNVWRKLPGSFTALPSFPRLSPSTEPSEWPSGEKVSRWYLKFDGSQQDQRKRTYGPVSLGWKFLLKFDPYALQLVHPDNPKPCIYPRQWVGQW